ncbi:MAG: hypothetical protein K6G07_07870 [Lachnospiraceae bacterium]|nr:hypothetical protein [Lachnospiraceae bacterium]
MRKINVLGIPLEDYTIRESMKNIDGFYRDGKLGTIGIITMKGLIRAQDDEDIKSWMSSLDMTIPADVDILHAGGIEARNRERDVESCAFLREFLKKLVRQKKKVYLLSETRESVNQLEASLRVYEPGIAVVAKSALDEIEQDHEFLVNDINVKMPGALISNLNSPLRERFRAENYMKLNAGIWLMLRPDWDAAKQNNGIFKRLNERFVKRWFRLRVNNYKDEGAEEKEFSGIREESYKEELVSDKNE